MLFVVDGKAGLVNEDREIAQLLHKHGKTVFLVVNKVDVKDAVDNMYEFESLGFSKSCFISASHGKNIVDLLELIVGHLPAPVMVDVEEPAYKVMLLGKPNVGKSSLMNLLLKKNVRLFLLKQGQLVKLLLSVLLFIKKIYNFLIRLVCAECVLLLNRLKA